VEKEMKLRHVAYFLAGFIPATLFNLYADHARGAEAKKDDMICLTNADLDKTMTEKGYDILLNMTNSEGVVESIWTSGQSIAITAAVPNEQKSCLLATMSKVTYNPKAIEEVWETYKKQTKQRDI
jgi:hypothetical protein